ncbi:MAG: aminoacyl-tRNA hydrolase [Alphaproteobacteria bacterium]|nr:aminoacyl-tRNA hydrolase [Alphaproteobacteria bacterium]
MPLVVTSQLIIPDRDLVFVPVKASGPGGQHVNRTESAVQLRFDAATCKALDDFTRSRLREVAGRRMTEAGEIVILAQRFRSQDANKDDARVRLAALIKNAATPPKRRWKTEPSKSALKRRRQTKSRRGTTKKLRARVRPEEE